MKQKTVIINGVRATVNVPDNCLITRKKIKYAKPIVTDWHEVHKYKCPKCNTSFSDGCGCEHKYCGYCGVKFKW